MDLSEIMWAKLFLGIFGIGMLMIVVGSVVYRIMDWWDSTWGGYGSNIDKTSLNNYNIGNIAKPHIYPKKPLNKGYMAGLLAGDRRNPPRADYFGRLDGKPYRGTGPYEEKYLNRWEKTHWDKQKDDAEQLRLDSEAKTNETSQVVDKMGQNCEKLIEIAPKEVKNGKKA